MREIGYRAWLKKDKKMVEVKSIHFGTKKIMYGYSESSHCYGNASCKFNDCELMQYTGLTDKNDKPIYEGDIITCMNTSKHSGYAIGKKMYGFIAYDDNYGYWFCKNNFQHYIDWSFADDIEVIGNLFDNPELLRGGK